MSKRTKIDPNKVYVAWQGASTDIDGVPHTVGTGTRLRGSEPIVQRLGEVAFVEDGTPESEWPNPQQVAAQQVGDVRDVRRTTVLSRRFRAVRTVEMTIDGEKRTVAKDELLEPGDPLPSLVPDAFESVTVTS